MIKSYVRYDGSVHIFFVGSLILINPTSICGHQKQNEGRNSKKRTVQTNLALALEASKTVKLPEYMSVTCNNYI